MFWKYIFPLLLCFFLAWFIRKFLCTKGYRRDEEEFRIPRLWIILLMAAGFIPIANYAIFGIVLVVIIVLQASDELHFRSKPFKNEKFHNWLMKN